MDGPFWEDFTIGETAASSARTITEAYIVTFAGLSGDFNPVHVDAEFAAASIFGQRIAHGLLGLAVASGLRMRGAVHHPAVMAFLGINNWTFRQPIRIGDTIRVHMTISAKRATSKPDRGIVTQQIELRNQSDEIVQQGEFTLMVRRRTAAEQRDAERQ
jgi:acyl dehydratase